MAYSTDTRQGSLFAALESDRLAAEAKRFAHYTVTEPPLIASKGIRDIVLNFETTGLAWWESDRPLSVAIRLPDGSLHYVSWGHRGGNIDEETARRWARRELRDLHITNINTKFDIHHAREWGVDLEAQNCTVSDVAHYAALLDDHRIEFNLDLLIKDFLGEEPMARLDESRMASYHAAEAAPRALYNVESVHRLKEAMWPELDKQDLQRVRALEDRVIYPVCEMEKNGAPIDHELLDRWIVESQKKYEEALWKLTKIAGFQVDPKRPERLWRHLGLPFEYLDSGKASFTDDIVKAQINHPAVQLLRYARKLATIRSNYLLKYKKVVDSKGILRYALHQLKSAKDPNRDYEGEAGTVTGRFSSAEIARGVGLNIQQEMKATKQRAAFGFEEEDESHDDEIFVIRRLRVPPSPQDQEWLTADAMQIEYRLFARYANNKEVIEAYRKDPLMSFHKYMHKRVLVYKTDQTYKQQKDLNFSYIYGAQLLKQALMLGHVTQREYLDIKRTKKYFDNPKLANTKEVRRIFDQELPEVKGLLERASFLAKPQCDDRCYERFGKMKGKLSKLHETEQHRGFVTTLLGRRGRFPDGQRLHKAFNIVVQGGAADIMKQKLVELHEQRKYTGLTLCYTVHDEADGYTPKDPVHARRVQEVLNAQSFPELSIPILWEVETGPNWAQCKAPEAQMSGLEETRAQLNYINTGRNRP